MMWLEALKGVSNPVRVNGVVYKDGQAAADSLVDYEGPVEINFGWDVAESSSEKRIQVAVKDYMLERSSPGFDDFMSRWNNDVPMPSTIMEGYILEEKEDRVKMSLSSREGPWTGWILRRMIKYTKEV